jgi:hypothetical protein
MYKFVDHSEVLSSKQKKNEIKFRLPDAGTAYENVCNVIEYSSNKYFA